MLEQRFRVSHIFLDVDGTLVDLAGGLRAASAEVATALSEWTGALVLPADIWRTRSEVAVQFAGQGSASRARMQAVWTETFRRLLGAQGTDDDARRAHELFHRARREHTAVFPDTVSALARLHDAGFTLVAASNGDVDLADVGLDRFIAMTHYAVEVGVSKPDPAFFTGGLARAGALPERSLAVGDRVDNDYEPARRAGMHALLINRDDQEPEADVRCIRSLEELPAIVELAPPAGAEAR